MSSTTTDTANRTLLNQLLKDEAIDIDDMADFSLAQLIHNSTEGIKR